MIQLHTSSALCIQSQSFLIFNVKKSTLALIISKSTYYIYFISWRVISYMTSCLKCCLKIWNQSFSLHRHLTKITHAPSDIHCCLMRLTDLSMPGYILANICLRQDNILRWRVNTPFHLRNRSNFIRKVSNSIYITNVGSKKDKS